MGDFIYDNLGKILVISIILGIGFIAFIGWYEVNHCVKSHHEMRYHPPMYVHSGSVSMPIGGGMQDDVICDQYK